MNATATTVEVSITHKCGHVVTYSLPEPRPVQYRSDAQIGQHHCDACKAQSTVIRPLPKGIAYEDADGLITIAFTENTYWERGALSKRDYEFIENFRPDCPKAWVKQTDDPAGAAAEVRWVRSRGWDCKDLTA